VPAVGAVAVVICVPPVDAVHQPVNVYAVVCWAVDVTDDGESALPPFVL